MTEKTKQDLEEICRTIRATMNVCQIYLFGSFAYGTPHAESDYDLYVIIPDDGPRPIEVMQQLNIALIHHRDVPLDILVGKETAFFSRANFPSLERTVYQKGVLLYGNEPRVQQALA